MNTNKIINGIPGTKEDTRVYALDIIPQVAEMDRLGVNKIGAELCRLGGMTATDVKEWKGEVKAYQKHMANLFKREQQRQKPESWPYDVEDGRMMLLTSHMTSEGFEEIDAKPIADLTAHIAVESTNPDTGEKVYEVCGRSLRGGKFCATVEAATFDRDNELKSVLGAAAGATAPIYHGMGGHLSPAIKLLTDEEKIQQSIHYNRTGWTVDGSRFLIPGNEPDRTTINLHRQLPYGLDVYDDDGDALEKGLKCLRLLLDFNPTKTAPILAGIFMAPMLRPAGLMNERCICFIVGLTNSFKTAFTKAAMSLYGAGFQHDQNMIEWGGFTRIGLMGLAGMASDVPIFIDNYKPQTGGGATALVSIAHSLSEGSDRIRAWKTGAVQDNNPLNCVPIFNGEDLPKTDAAALARMVPVRFDVHADGNSKEVTMITEIYRLVGYLNAVGRQWLTWLEGEEGQSCAKGAHEIFERKRVEWRAYLDRNFPESQIKARIASNLAVLETAWSIMLEHPTICDIADEYYAFLLTGLGEAAQYLIEGTNESIEAVRFVEALKELISSNKILMSESRQSYSLADGSDPSTSRIVGWYEPDGSACILPRMAIQAVMKLAGDDLNGVTRNTISQQLADKGMILRTTKGRGRTWLVNLSGKPQIGVINLKPGVIRDMDRVDEDEDDIVDEIPIDL